MTTYYHSLHVTLYYHIKRNWQPTVWCSRKNMQRNKQVAMGRKKFNMDPKKVGSNVVILQKCDLSPVFISSM